MKVNAELKLSKAFFMQLTENNINSFHCAHPTHVSSFVDMKLIPPKRFWYLYGSGSFTMSIIVVPRQG